MFARLMLIFPLFFIAPLANADCPMQKRQITGHVEMAGQPVIGARVQARWDEERARDLAARARTDDKGDFEVSMSIDSYDGRTLGAKERCGYVPKRVELRVRHDDAREFSRNYKFDELSKPLNIKLRAN